MTKLLSLVICLLVLKAISAMPVTDVERKDAVPALSVVPLEKSAEKILELPVEAIKSESIPLNEAVLVAKESPKKPEESISKNVDVKSFEKPEEKKPEVEAQKSEEEKKIEEPKSVEPQTAVERKRNEEVNIEPSQNQQQGISSEAESPSAKKVDEVQPSGESPVAEVNEAVVSVPEEKAASPLAVAEIAVEPTIQAKKIDEVVATEKIEEPVKISAKAEEKPDRVIREAEEAAKLKAAVAKQRPLENAAEKPAEKAKPVVAAASSIADDEKLNESPVQIIAENSQPQVEPALATVAVALPQEPKIVTESKSSGELSASKPIARTVSEAEVQNQAAIQPQPNPAKAEVVSPVQQSQEIAKEQRSEDTVAPVEVANVAQVVPQNEVVAIVAEGDKEAVAGVEKSAKSADEPKEAEELPQPQEVKDAKIELAKGAAESEPVKDEQPKAQEPIQEFLKKEEKKESSEEDSSSEEKKERKNDQKESSLEDSSEEKKEEQKELASSKSAVEPATNANSS